MDTDLFDSYATDGSANIISISVTVGYAQIGSTSIAINSVPYIIPPADARGNYPNSFTINLGSNASLAGKTLQVVSTITRVQPVTNATVIIELTSNGVTHTYTTIGGSIDALGGVLPCFALITFN